MNDEIKKIEESFVKYKEEVYPHLLNHVSRGQADFESILNVLYQLYLISAFILDTKLKQVDSKQKYILNFYLRSSISLHGIYHLCKNGIITDASLSLRSMFENVIYLKTILHADTEYRLMLYTEYDKVNKWLNAKKLKSFQQPGRNKSKEEYEKIRSDYEKVKSYYHPKSPYHWYWKIYDQDNDKNGVNCNLAYLCGKLKWLDQYYTVYNATSVISHGNNISRTLYRSKKSITLAPIFDEKLYPIISLGAFYFSQIAGDVLDYFKINKAYKIYVLTITRIIQKKCKG